MPWSSISKTICSLQEFVLPEEQGSLWSLFVNLCGRLLALATSLGLHLSFVSSTTSLSLLHLHTSAFSATLCESGPVEKSWLTSCEKDWRLPGLSILIMVGTEFLYSPLVEWQRFMIKIVENIQFEQWPNAADSTPNAADSTPNAHMNKHKVCLFNDGKCFTSSDKDKICSL